MKKRNIDILTFVEKDLKAVLQNRDFEQLTKDQQQKSNQATPHQMEQS